MLNQSSTFTCSIVTFLASSSLSACSVSRSILIVANSLTLGQHTYKSTTLVIPCKRVHSSHWTHFHPSLVVRNSFEDSVQNDSVTLMLAGREWWKYEAFTCSCHVQPKRQISHSAAGTICFQLVERTFHISCSSHSSTHNA